MSATVLIVSHADDLHAGEVMAQLQQQGVQAKLFDTARLPARMGLTIGHDPVAGWSAQAEPTESGADERLDLAEVRSVWWRRPQPFEIDPLVGGGVDRHFALAETHAAVGGLWALLNARWMNEPDRDERAARKAWQLDVARRAGLSIPRTCITNDPARARAFIDAEQGQVIYKTFTASEAAWRETRLLLRNELEVLDAVRFAPVIFQQLVPAVADLRVTVVGDRVFPAAIRLPVDAYAYDFRMSMGACTITPCTLPGAVKQGLRRLMRMLGLVYGAVDFRLTPAGEHVFLEVNPAGQWLFVERATGQAISAAIAAQLAAWVDAPRGAAHERHGELTEACV